MPQMTAMQRAASAALAIASTAFLVESARGGFPATAAFAAAVAGIWLASVQRAASPWSDRPALGVFLVCFAAYLSTFRWHGGDDLPNTLVPLALLRHGTLALDVFYEAWFANLPQPSDFVLRTPGGLLSVYPIAPGLLALPVFAVPAFAAPPMSSEYLHQLSKVSGALVTAASAAVLYKAAACRATREWALLLAFLYGIGSWAFSVCGQAIWQHGAASLGVALALWGLSREGRGRDVLAGFGMGLSVASRPDHVFFLAAALAFVLWKRRDRLPGVLLGGAVPALLLFWYWVHYTGRLRPPEFGVQASGFGGFHPPALAALLFSPHRGLFFFFPAAVFGLWAAWRRRAEGLAPLLVAGFLAQIIFYCFYENWVGGRSFGTRYFSSFSAALCWILAGVEDELRASPRALAAFLFSAAACLLLHAVGGYFSWPGDWVIADTVANVWDWRLHPFIFVFAKGGGLGSLAWPLQALAAAAALSAAAGLVRVLMRRLSRAPAL